MASMNRKQLEELYFFLKEVWQVEEGGDKQGLADDARKHAKRVEGCIGQVEAQGPEDWEK